MRHLLDVLARSTERRPIALLLALGVVTIVLGIFASQQQVDADLTSFAPETERFAAFERIQDDFAGTGNTVQVIVDAGADGDVLSAAALADVEAIAEAVHSDAEAAAVLAEPTAATPVVLSYATPLLGAIEQQGGSLEQLDDPAVDALAQQVYGSPQGAALAALLSQDRDLEQASARAGIVVVGLDAELEDAELADASLAVRDAVEAAELTAVEASPFNQMILFSELESGMTDELPFLLGLSFLLILGILAVVYRSVSDVLIGLGGLVVTIVWMYGIGVLLGPEYLGVAGNFSQITIVVPVLLVGLGIDYAIHLTSRYREERASGSEPSAAAGTSLRSVGGALVLATITTMVGFLTNLVTPLPPLRDFGMFAAAGVLSAFVVMGLLVPSARHALDRRRLRRGRGRTLVGGTGGTGPAALRRVMARTATLTEHAPRLTLAIALAVTVVAGAAASQVSTEFSQSDFIPDDSYAGQVL
ncbi:MAG: MMPL family transporter, partial [Nitriliruptoraceae bacterium]